MELVPALMLLRLIVQMKKSKQSRFSIKLFIKRRIHTRCSTLSATFCDQKDATTGL
jgi:hypothetical protein